MVELIVAGVSAARYSNLSVSTLLVIALLAAQAEGDADRVKRMVGEALAAFDAGRFEEAAQLYLQAHDALVSAKLPEKPMLFFNAGLAYERAGICERAASRRGRRRRLQSHARGRGPRGRHATRYSARDHR